MYKGHGFETTRLKRKIRKFKDNVPFLSCLSEDEITELEQVVVEKRFSKGDIILLEEDTCKHLYIVYSGKVKAVKTGADGKEYILSIHKKGDFFGEMGILDGKTAPAAVVAMDDVEIGLVGKETFERYLLSKPKVLREIITILCARLREAWLKLRIVGFVDADSRIRAVLELIALQHGIKDARGTIISLKLTHKDIANFSSLSRETVTRRLQKLVETEEIEIIEEKRILLKPDFFQHSIVM